MARFVPAFLPLGVLALACGDAPAQPSRELTGTESAGTPTTSAGTDGVESSADDSSSGGADGASSDEGTGGDDGPRDAGTVVLHRLNRAEYDNTVRDLLGTTQTPAADFPADNFSFGFDNIAEVLVMSPAHFDLYERSARKLVEELWPPTPVSTELTFEAEIIDKTHGRECCVGWWNMIRNGEIYTTHDVPSAGTYTMTVSAFQRKAGSEDAHMDFEIDGNAVAGFDVSATTKDMAQTFETDVQLDAGLHRIAAKFTNFADDPTDGERHLRMDWIKLEGPHPTPMPDNSTFRAVIPCDPIGDGAETCLREVAESFGRRAWRRPLSEDEVDGLLALSRVAEADRRFEDATHTLLRALLVSPNFLFRVELDADPSSEESHPLSQFELASRLSYFLWSSTPDEVLLDLAQEGALDDNEELRRQVERMLADPRADALVVNFAGQWLGGRGIASATKDTAIYPEFDEALKGSMRVEQEMFFRTFLDEARGMDELLTAKETFVDDSLARLYKLATTGQPGFRRVATAETRAGVLTQAGLLAVESHPDRSSPVLRGKWIMEQLLCTPPPPPPPGADTVEIEPIPGETTRERLARHREDPACASCHALIDPIGFGLEHFDGIGAFRATEQGHPVDASGKLPNGATFVGASEMAAAIAESPQYPKCVAEKTYMYALGRGTTAADFPYLEDIEAAFQSGGLQLRELLVAIVTSEPFRTRRGGAQ